MESVYGTDSGIWGDPLLWWGDCSEYLPGRYVWIRATSTRDLHLSMPPLEDAIPPGPVAIPPYRPPAGAGQLRSAMGMRGIVPQAPQMPTPIRQPPLFPQSRQATPYQQQVQPPSKTSGLGVTFDSSATKPAPTNSQDTDVCRRQATRGRHDGRWPASHPRGGRERSSIRKTNMSMPRQEGGRPVRVPRNPPPSSTSGSKGASTDPLESIANYRSQGWKKDLSHVLRGFYLYNYPSSTEADWEKLRIKFLNHLGQCQDKWKTIKEEAPLKYMPYMEHQFLLLTSIRLKGLSQFTGWIKPGSYYHGVVAKKGQLSKCLHLARIPPPTRPQIHPSETQALTQRPVETPQPVPVCLANRVSLPREHALMLPLPWRWEEQGMVILGWTRSRPALRKNGGETDQPSIPGHRLGDGTPALSIPSCSRIVREDKRLCSSSTIIPMSSLRRIMMWLPRE